VCAVVPADHRFARSGRPVPLHDLADESLVVTGASGTAAAEALDLLARRGVVTSARATADCPETVAALVRAGLGVGLLTGVAAGGVTDAETVAVPLADPGLTRSVSAYWYDVLLHTDLGRALHREVLASTAPPGAIPADAAGPAGQA
jgi:DNA-binding transcriptional LysR family regulator